MFKGIPNNLERISEIVEEKVEKDISLTSQKLKEIEERDLKNLQSIEKLKLKKEKDAIELQNFKVDL